MGYFYFGVLFLFRTCTARYLTIYWTEYLIAAKLLESEADFERANQKETWPSSFKFIETSLKWAISI